MISRAFALTWLVLVASAASRALAIAASDGPGVPPYIHHYAPVLVASPAAGTAGTAGGPLTMSFTTMGRQFDLELEPSGLFTADARVQLVGANGVVRQVPVARGNFFRGVVTGEDGSWVRLGIEGDELSGIVATNAEVYFLEPARHFFGAKAAGRSVAFRLSDTDPAPLGACAAHAPARPAFARNIIGGSKAWPHPMTRELAARADVGAAALVADKRAELGIVGDFQYFSKHGDASAQDLAATVNAVDGIYQSELGVAIQIRSTVIFTTADDPFTETTDYNTLLNQFSTYHDNNDNTPSQSMYNCDLAHLVSGRDFNGDVIGLAWLGTLCGGYWGSGISQDFTSSQYVLTLLMAHEIGHNFGAPHDAQNGSVCQSAPSTFIMNPFLGSNLLQQFSPCSKTEIAKEVNLATCFDAFTPGPSATPTPSFTPTRPPPPPTGTSTRTPTRTRTPVPGSIPAPSIIEPVSGQVIEVEGVTFTWSAVATATAYDLRVVNAQGGTTIFTGSLTGNASTTTVISLPNDGSYTFRVRACVNAISDGTCSLFASRTFSVTKDAPSEAPTITAPSAGAQLTASTFTFAWTGITPPASGTLFYEMRLLNVTSGQTELQLRTFHPTTSSNEILRSGHYSLQVRACEAGCGPYSAPVAFSVALGAVPSGVPTINAATISGGNSLSANWTSVARAEWYQLQAVQLPPAGPGGGALTVASRQVFGTSVSNVPVPQGTAYVLVAACNGDGCGPYSGGKQINPSGPNPAAPHIGVPIINSVVDGPSVLFAWSRIPGDTGGNTLYRVYVQDLSRQTAALDVLTTQNYYGALLKAEGAKYAVVVIANPGTPAEIAGPGAAFTVRGTSSVAPTLMAPTHESTQPAGNILIAWSSVPGATLYEYFVAVQGQPNPSGRGVTPGYFVQVPLAAINGQPTVYSGIIRACPAGATCVGGSDAGWSPWSNVAGTGGINFTVTP